MMMKMLLYVEMIGDASTSKQIIIKNMDTYWGTKKRKPITWIVYRTERKQTNHKNELQCVGSAVGGREHLFDIPEKVLGHVLLDVVLIVD